MKESEKKKSCRAEKLEALDEATECCAHIATVAELLESCASADWLTAETVARTGSLLLSETEKLTGLLKDCRAPAAIETIGFNIMETNGDAHKSMRAFRHARLRYG